MIHEYFERFITTEKQKQFDTDFFQDAEAYEAWDEIDFKSDEEILGEQTFLIKAEDMKAYAMGAPPHLLDNGRFLVHRS